VNFKVDPAKLPGFSGQLHLATLATLVVFCSDMNRIEAFDTRVECRRILL
jgi:hypothetical protein